MQVLALGGMLRLLWKGGARPFQLDSLINYTFDFYRQICLFMNLSDQGSKKMRDDTEIVWVSYHVLPIVRELDTSPYVDLQTRILAAEGLRT